MDLPQLQPYSFAPLLELERARLLDLVRSLDVDDWGRPTPCPGWSVLDLAVHLVGDDLSSISWQRDGHRGTSPPEGLDERGFIEWIDDLQREWVHAARRLSPRLVVELLGWANALLVDAIHAHDPTAVDAHVSWADDGLVPRWLDHSRELSERWLHRQQLLQAVGRPSDLRSDLALPVLDGLRWAYPFRLGAIERPSGTTVRVDVTGPEVEVTWHLVRNAGAWSFHPEPAGAPAARLAATTEQAWRMLSNNLDRDRDGDVITSGDPEVVAVLLQTRAIIGVPR